jgi:repressor LexA
MTLTRRQRQILDFIRRFIAGRGYAPSLMEIGGEFGLTSPATIHKHLKALVERGALRHPAGGRRRLEVVEEERPAIVTLPILGAVAAGRPIEAVEEGETLPVPEALTRGRPAYLLRVRGDSMRDEQIRDGDYVVVEERRTAENGETVIALIGGREATVKRFFREKGRVRLEPANPGFPPLVFPGREVRIQGVIRGLVRRY